MDNRKRARLGAPTSITTSSGCNVSLGGSLIGTATLANIAGGQSIFLTSGSLGGGDALELPANVLFTICDDENSDESQEYLIETCETECSLTTALADTVAGLSTHIKQEPTQYRLVNPGKLQRSSQPPPLVSTQHGGAAPTTATTTATILPTSVQLPSGCEIYLVKEYVDTNGTTNRNITTINNDELLQSFADVQPLVRTTTAQPATIKLEPNLRVTQQYVAPKLTATVTTTTPTTSSHPAATSGVGIVNMPGLLTHTKAIATAGPGSGAGAGAGAGAGPVAGDEMKLNKRSYILEAYKKRDDKRRATHNEVERRRRDKINSWIFKLKEMLPTEMPAAAAAANAAEIAAYSTATTITTTQTTTTAAAAAANIALEQQQQQQQQQLQQHLQQQQRKTCDSKSQILIKACEYIKAMQDEIQTLRECLTTTEQENQRLQNELDLFKSQAPNAATNMLINNNNNNNNNNCSSNKINNNNLRNNCGSSCNSPAPAPAPTPSNSSFHITLNTLNGATLFASDSLSSSLSSSSTSSTSAAATNDITVTTTTTSSSPSRTTAAAAAAAAGAAAAPSITFTKRKLIITDYVD